MRTLLCVAVLAAVSARKASSRDEIIKGLTAQVPDTEFDCAWRVYAYEYAQQIQPGITDANLAHVYDALQLQTLCNVSTTDLPRHRPVPACGSVELAANAIYVDIVNGEDSNAGTQAAPLQHLQAAVTLSRTVQHPVQIILRQGMYHIAQTINLTVADSGLSFASFPGENVVVTGAVPLTGIQWQPYNVSTGGKQWVVMNNTNDVYSATPNGVTILNYTRTETWQDCQTACENYAGCTAFTWHDSVWPIEYNDTCWLRTDGSWAPVAEHDHVAGYWTSPTNIYVADVSGMGIPSLDANVDVPSLIYSPDGGYTFARATRARYPNANPELEQWPAGWQTISSGGSYFGDTVDVFSTEVVHVSLPENAHAGEFADYYWGYAKDDTSACGKLTPNGSYWCQPYGRVANATYWYGQPTGFEYTPAVLPNGAPYTHSPVGGIFNFWRGGHWFSLMGRIDTYTPANNSLQFHYGGFQGAEGEKGGEDWFIENLFDELDAPNEFYYDAEAGKIYLFWNATTATPPPASTAFYYAANPIIFNIQGTPEAPVTDISFTGITFTATAPTYMAPHGIPSGGDWALSRMGAILIEGAELVTVSNCTFTRVDGNAIFLSGYTRNVTIDSSIFEWLGESAVVSWGRTEDVDGTAGTQPWYTRMTNCICREWGVFEKQTSCWFQAVTPLAYVANNIFFNGPRAAANINDNFGGGTVIESNLGWNSCRESQDHGTINTWGRVPYITTVRNGTASVIPADNVIRHNFLVAGGGANGGAVDNDDGTNSMQMYNNFFVYGGFKSDFQGFAKSFYNNVAAYSYVYGYVCANIMDMAAVGWGEGYYNNTCILPAGGTQYFSVGNGCSVNQPASFTFTLGNNRIYAGDSSVTARCGSQTFTMAQWLNYSYDKGTTFQPSLPSAATIIDMAKAVLA